VASVHRAFIAFHNRVHDHFAARGLPQPRLLRAARETVVMHYQWPR
jgi:hypothetical protein